MNNAFGSFSLGPLVWNNEEDNSRPVMKGLAARLLTGVRDECGNHLVNCGT